ncbi:hypothetical protein JZ751_002848 [Albula glossodonta]|uniref:Uncharacterized protein n=1 Tax=Albula glossodonta TaxID=121402 RepID=A0A8T2NCH0_9TELE|nr:hypothetical protein JZ751_002848 [Albula glossodonta]
MDVVHPSLFFTGGPNFRQALLRLEGRRTDPSLEVRPGSCMACLQGTCSPGQSDIQTAVRNPDKVMDLNNLQIDGTMNSALYQEILKENIEDIVTRIQDEKTGGVPVRTVKSFLSKIPSVVTERSRGNGLCAAAVNRSSMT